jgi:hypothetical protein
MKYETLEERVRANERSTGALTVHWNIVIHAPNLCSDWDSFVTQISVRIKYFQDIEVNSSVTHDDEQTN